MATKTKTPNFVQLRANRLTDDGHVEPAQHRDEVEFFSIYLGWHGDNQWVADFEYGSDAISAVRYLELALHCDIDRSQYDAVMSTPAPVSQPKGHPHAALMAEYAKDAAETDKPWDRWETRVGSNQPWSTCIAHPSWLVAHSYRRKPELPKTIMINGFEVPAPLDKVQVGTVVYVANPASIDLCVEVAYVSWHSLYFDRKIVHATREAAVAHAKAMLGVNPKGDA